MVVKIKDGKKDIEFYCESCDLDGARIDFKNAEDDKRFCSAVIEGLKAIGYTYTGESNRVGRDDHSSRTP